MPTFPPRKGQLVKASRDIPLMGNVHVRALSSSAPQMLHKGTVAEISDITSVHIDLNCKDGSGAAGIHGWGLKIRVARVVWGTAFEDA